MKRILLMVFRNLFLAPYYFLKLLYYGNHSDKYSMEDKFDLMRRIVKIANRGGNIELVTSGQENVPTEGGAMMFPNHQGMYDVLAMIYTCPRFFSVVAKIEAQKIPFVRHALSCMNAYYMDRSNLRQSMEVINSMAADVKEGKVFVIFPEGTRSRKGNELLEFKAGSFKSATKAKCPIVPVALVNAFEPFDTNSIRRVTVQIHYLKAIEYDDYKDMKTGEIAQMVHDQIEKKIREINM